MTGLLTRVAVLVVVRSGLAWLREVSALFTATAVKERVRVLDKLVELGPGFLPRTRTGAVRSTVVDGIEGLQPDTIHVWRSVR